MDEPAGLQNKMIKGMDTRAWDAALEHCRARDESMAGFAARAFRQMIERDRGAPLFTMPDERPPRAAALPAAPVPVETAADLAALMQGMAAMATASGQPVPKDFRREASALGRDSLRIARGKAPLASRNPPWPHQRALPAPGAAG